MIASFLPLKGLKVMPHLQNGNMGDRRTMPRKHSKKNFTKKALNTKSQNFVQGVMRGGIRF